MVRESAGHSARLAPGAEHGIDVVDTDVLDAGCMKIILQVAVKDIGQLTDFANHASGSPSG
jgi:hypothetical protein